MSKKRVTFKAGLKPQKSYGFTERPESDLIDAPVVDVTTGKNKAFCSVVVDEGKKKGRYPFNVESLMALDNSPVQLDDKGVAYIEPEGLLISYPSDANSVPTFRYAQ